MDKDNVIPVGIHFHLDEDLYHADPALGSSNLRKLITSPPDFWWYSDMNPLAEQIAEAAKKTTPAKIIGKAAHKAVLEGVEKFRALYAPTFHPGNVKAGKDEVEAILAEGKTPLKRDDFNAVAVAAEMIRSNPYLGKAFSNGAPEVSVFWEEDGVRMKCRFDYLKPHGVMDLKSIRNFMDREFKDACRRRFAEHRFDVQAAHYMTGREHVPALWNEGKVFVWLGEEMESVSEGSRYDKLIPRNLMNEVAEATEWAFVFVFWQAEDAPITWGLQLDPKNPIIEIGRMGKAKALENYRKFMQDFGPTRAWVIAEPLEELHQEELPPWFARS
jgi:hypothetical protein